MSVQFKNAKWAVYYFIKRMSNSRVSLFDDKKTEQLVITASVLSRFICGESIISTFVFDKDVRSWTP